MKKLKNKLKKLQPFDLMRNKINIMKKFINGKMINLIEPRLGSKVILKLMIFASAHRILKSEITVLK